MPGFLRLVASWQHEARVGAAATTLIGFSQGAIMSLEATQQSASPVGRVVAIAGRFALPPRQAPATTQFHLLHGEHDRVMPIELAVRAHQQVQALGAASTLDRFPGLGHGIDARVMECVQRRITTPAAGSSV